mmetsp:Transcript_31662/g.40590  ORF Transcript_31662/g.40590 Transcript_31662/m.40590 type:complete len:195 (+) Transcript_31662:429-1013(+)
MFGLVGRRIAFHLLLKKMRMLSSQEIGICRKTIGWLGLGVFFSGSLYYVLSYGANHGTPMIKLWIYCFSLVLLESTVVIFSLRIILMHKVVAKLMQTQISMSAIDGIPGYSTSKQIACMFPDFSSSKIIQAKLSPSQCPEVKAYFTPNSFCWRVYYFLFHSIWRIPVMIFCLFHHEMQILMVDLFLACLIGYIF